MDDQSIILLSVTIVIIIGLVIAVFYLYKKNQLTAKQLEKKQTGAYNMGTNQTKGNFYQILGTFSILTDYDHLGFISTTSKQMPIDMIGIKNDRIDFIEFKKKGADLSTPENKIKKLVDAKQVNYLVKDVEFPEGFEVEDRENKKQKSS